VARYHEAGSLQQARGYCELVGLLAVLTTAGFLHVWPAFACGVT
jgi:hypothetical protein